MERKKEETPATKCDVKCGGVQTADCRIQFPSEHQSVDIAAATVLRACFFSLFFFWLTKAKSEIKNMLCRLPVAATTGKSARTCECVCVQNAKSQQRNQKHAAACRNKTRAPSNVGDVKCNVERVTATAAARDSYISTMPSGRLAGISVRPLRRQSTMLLLQVQLGGHTATWGAQVLDSV